MGAQNTHEDIDTFTDRVRVADALGAVYKGDEAQEKFFDCVILPNLLPEAYPESTVEGATWINAKAKASLALSKTALSEDLRELVDVGEIETEDALLCIHALGLPQPFKDAKILQLVPNTNVPPEDPDHAPAKVVRGRFCATA